MATLLYVERERPLAPADQLVASTLESEPSLCPEVVGPIERLVTAEGEYAALATVQARLAGQPVQLDLGFVFGDDFYARLACVARAGERFTTVVRDLVIADAHMLGVRRRPFCYTPPPGWREVAYGLESRFTLSDEPEVGITVWPATPRPPGTPELVGSLVAAAMEGPFRVEQRSGPHPVSSKDGPSGHLWQMVGHFASRTRLTRDLAILADERFYYAARLDTSCDPGVRARHQSSFFDMVRSFERIPAPPLWAAAVPGLFPVD